MFTELPLPWVVFLANSHDSPIPMILHWPGATTPEDIGETLTGESGQFSVALSSSSVVSVSIITGEDLWGERPTDYRPAPDDVFIF